MTSAAMLSVSASMHVPVTKQNDPHQTRKLVMYADTHVITRVHAVPFIGSV